MKTKKQNIMKGNKKTKQTAGMNSSNGKQSSKSSRSSSSKRHKAPLDFNNMDEMHEYYMKHNKEYQIQVHQYEHYKRSYIDAPITEHEFAFEHTLNHEKAIENIKRKRKSKFDESHPHPKIIKFVHDGLLGER